MVASHPTRVRGLKSTKTGITPNLGESHPTRVRGLKSNYSEEPLEEAGRTLHGCVD